jgi:lipopolysaccharide export LptBFGC system permease protein LptF
MAAIERQNNALQTIFSFFLGLMVVAFIGVGVNTFLPSPAEKYTKQIREMSQRQEVLSRQGTPGNYTAAQQAQLDSLTAAQGDQRDKQQAELKDWARITSIILVIFATLVLAVSLILSEQLRVISNGLLLGGLFTMLYGVGWVIFSGNSVTRFWVILFAFIVAIGLGYLKFVRGRGKKETVPVEGGAVVDDAALGSLSSRVAALEQRAAAAAVALAGEAPEGQ